MTQAHIFVFGFVQGVGFRHFVKSKAKELDLTGFVRNLPDGRVEVLVQGSNEKIENLVKLCKKGPFLSEVEEVKVEWEEGSDKYESFDIL